MILTGRQKQANTIMGAGNPNWKGGQITKYCVRCGEVFGVYPSTSNGIPQINSIKNKRGEI